MTKAAVIHAQPTLDNFSNRNLDIALKVLEIASIHGYEDINWAINCYNKDYKVNYNTTPSNKSKANTFVPAPRGRMSDEVF